MGQDKEQLKKLLAFIDALSKEQGNEWYVEELTKRFGNTSNLSSSKIDDIYELCVEKILREQAEQFYNDFTIDSIKLQLIEDFIRMERFKRANNFEDFCMALYQQIEGVTNKICSDGDLIAVAEKLMSYPVYTTGKFDERIGNYLVSKLLFLDKYIDKSKSYINSHQAIDKIKCVIYFVIYKAEMKSTEYDEYVNLVSVINSLYQFRNKNHRGSEPTEYQIGIFNKIEPFKSQYYLKYLGTLAFFISKVNEGFPISDSLVSYCRTLDNKSIESDIKVVGIVKLSEADLNKKRFK